MTPVFYVVFQEGVYRHACVGVFSTIDVAVDAATKAMKAERDDYHHYEVVPFVLNSAEEEKSAVMEISRNGSEIKVG